MKHSLLCLAATIVAGSSFATIRNVSNAPNAPVNAPYSYNSLSGAVDDLADGDTIYLHGTNVSYGDVTITNKTVTIIGAGYGNNLQNATNMATIVGVLSFSEYTGVKNVSLIGLRMEEPKCGNESAKRINTLYIERCGIRPNYNTSNWLRCNTLFLKQSVLGDHPSEATEFAPVVSATAFISNSVIQGKFQGNNTANAMFENNIFKRTYPGDYVGYGSVYYFYGNATFNNNIFLAGYGLDYISGCTFNHNLFESNVTFTDNVNNNNVTNTNAGLVNNAQSGSKMARGAYSTSVDYHLTTGSAAKGTGMGNTDMGIYGGTGAIPTVYTLNGVPAMPRVTQMTIQNMSVAPGGNLNVEIQAVKQD